MRGRGDEARNKLEIFSGTRGIDSSFIAYRARSPIVNYLVRLYVRNKDCLSARQELRFRARVTSTGRSLIPNGDSADLDLRRLNSIYPAYCVISSAVLYRSAILETGRLNAR